MSTSFDIEEVYRINVQKSGAAHNNRSMVLHSEPSFSIYNNTQNQDSEYGNELAKSDDLTERSVTIGNLPDALGRGEFTFGKNMGLIVENSIEEEEKEMGDEKIDRLSGLVKTFKIGGGGPQKLGGEFIKNGDLREYYNFVLEEEPSNPLFLRNYGHFLQCQGDSSGAEEYYYRAILADPKDGETLMQYAKLVWELHHDRPKASSYLERAVSAAFDDSDVQAACARFLWEMEKSEEEDDGISSSTITQVPFIPPLHLARGLGLEAPRLGNGLSSNNNAETSSGDKPNIEVHHRRENPGDPRYLTNYAEFLHQCKGDIAGALEYYSRAALVVPSDREIISHYDRLVWQLHHDKGEAATYLEQAVHASPENSNMLGDIARFLWEVEEDDVGIPQGMQAHMSTSEQ